MAVMDQTNDRRLRVIAIAPVKHPHAFIRDVRPGEDEFREAAEILNQLGRSSSGTHNEPVLTAGSLGVSTLVRLLNNGDNGATETSQNLLGRFGE